MSRSSNDSEEDGEIDREETRYNMVSSSVTSPTKDYAEQADDSDSYDTEDGGEDMLHIQPPQATIVIPKRDRRDRKRDRHSRKHESSHSRGKDRRPSSRDRSGGHRDSRRAAADSSSSHRSSSTRNRDTREHDNRHRQAHRTEEKVRAPPRDVGRSVQRELKEVSRSDLRDAREKIREAKEAREQREREQREKEEREQCLTFEIYAILTFFAAAEVAKLTNRERSRSPLARSLDDRSDLPEISLTVEDERLTDIDSSSSDDDSEDDEKYSEDGKVDGTDVEMKEVAQKAETAEANTTGEASPLSEDDDDDAQLPPYLPAIQGCRSVEEFHCLNRIEEGTYGVVYRARDKQTDEIVALKRLKMEKEKEGFPITSLREINTLLKAQHPNIVTVREIVVGSNMDKIYIVMDYVEHDLKSLMEVMKQPFLVGEVKTLMLQLLKAVAHLHDNWILHRDLKTSNLLLSHKGILKVGDFGLAREYGSPLKHYTPIVVTMWYRAPELLLGVKDLGTPSEKIWPGYTELPLVKKVTFTEHPYNNLRSRFGHTLSNLGFDLINKFLTYYPQRRITAEEALKHEFFNETPVPVDPSMFPTWPAKSELGHRKAQSPKPPSGGKQFAKQLGEGDDEGLLAAAGFHMNIPSKGSSAKGTGFSLKF
ncbi:hypothetical protein HPB52_018566 [Rhipicephalus sanguineus]|uniref:cyclin-dependent kinase n=1 Tax=Rhipicephalus sanguineus TaxID=34632 RepID=A0A9D4PX10_RHISA|nr:hypothetical protein HPB52_018566 [Rhipicephalus sanguineus]